MRRYPLTAAVTALLLVVACARANATPGGPAGQPVLIATAPGDRLAFEPAEVMVASGPLDLTFTNRSRLAHNLVFTSGIDARSRTIVEPGTSDRLLLAPPAPGAYPFVCTIHDGMAGKLIVLAATAGR